MELFGLVASVPITFCLIAHYRLIVLSFTARYHWGIPLLRPASYFLLALIALEVAMIATLGPAQSQTRIGPLFLPVHFMLFLLGTPALANVILLRSSIGPALKWYLVASVCALFAFFLVLLEYHVTEGLFGVDG